MKFKDIQEAKYHRPNYIQWIYQTIDKIVNDPKYTFVDDFIVLPLDQREEVERQLTAEFGERQFMTQPHRPWWTTTVNGREFYIDTDVTPDGDQMELGIEVRDEDE